MADVDNPRNDDLLWRAWTTAPTAPLCLVRTVVAFMEAPNVTSDALLSLADAMDEAAQTAAFAGETALATDLRKLAGLPRALAPRLAEIIRDDCS